MIQQGVSNKFRQRGIGARFQSTFVLPMLVTIHMRLNVLECNEAVSLSSRAMSNGAEVGIMLLTHMLGEVILSSK
jgi:hypothetical protein